VRFAVAPAVVAAEDADRVGAGLGAALHAQLSGEYDHGQDVVHADPAGRRACSVAGFDVARQPQAVRRRIGLVFQVPDRPRLRDVHTGGNHRRVRLQEVPVPRDCGHDGHVDRPLVGDLDRPPEAA
jgi:hypothetical protein